MKPVPLKITLFFLLSLFFLQCNEKIDSDLKYDVTSAELEARFRNPPPESRPWVYWFWMNGNITKEGITADLEAMHRIGVGGAIFMGVGLGSPVGEVAFDSPEWHDLFTHACQTCVRLGMKLVLHQCDGWAMAGGQWIKPEQSIKLLVWNDREIEGPIQGTFRIDRPLTQEGFYKDVALIAVPLKPLLPPVPAVITVDGAPAPALNDGDFLHGETIGKVIQIDFERPATVASLVMHIPQFAYQFASTFPGTVEVSGDGVTYTPVVTFDMDVSEDFRDRETFTISFPAREVKTVRIVFEKLRATQIGEIEVLSEPRVHLWEVKSGFAQKREHGGETFILDGDIFPAEIAGISPQEIIDLTGKMDDDGNFDWTEPQGRWKIIRIGMTSSGKEVVPRTTNGGGLETDKMNREAVRHHFNSFAKKVIERNNITKGNPIMGIHTDSWESGPHTWSSDFLHAFERLRGYSMTSWLPVVTSGLVVGNARESERFLWDLRRTMADLLTAHFFGEMQRCAHESDVLYQSEASGRQMFMYDPLNYQSRNDLPIGEFWRQPTDLRVDCRVAASVAHTYHRPIVGAEAFTTVDGGLRNAPFDFKALGDMAFCEGVNRFYIHRYCMQPWDVEPGITFSHFGINFDRTQTWWENGGRAWCDYLSSCQTLLQSGAFVADVIHYIGDDAPNFLGHRDDLWNPIPPGYDFDGCNLEILKRLEVTADGRLTLPHGMSYRVLLLPSREQMTLEALQTIEQLVRNGATVIGPRPVRTPGWKDYRQNDEKLQKLTKTIWGAIDGKNVTENKYGKGSVVYGPAMDEILSKITPPDFDYSCEQKEGPNNAAYSQTSQAATQNEGPNNTAYSQTSQAAIQNERSHNAAYSQTLQAATQKEGPLHYIHCKTSDADFYFVANSDESKGVKAVVRFRISGKCPELWNPATRTITKPAIYHEKDGILEMPLYLEPAGSVFVVFREPANPRAIVSVAQGSKQLFPPEGDSRLRGNDAESGQGDSRLRGNDAGDGQGDSRLRGNDAEDGQGDSRLRGNDAGGGLPILYFAADTGLSLDSGEPGHYILTTQAGNTISMTIPVPKQGLILQEPWDVAFPPGRQAPAQISMEKLMSWTASDDDGVKYFSGTATYSTTFDWPPPGSVKEAVSLDLAKENDPKKEAVDLAKENDPKKEAVDLVKENDPKKEAVDLVKENDPKKEAVDLAKENDPKKEVVDVEGEANMVEISLKEVVMLDLGEVKDIAEVKLNGIVLGVLWKPQYVVDITGAVRGGVNELEIQVTNLWPNRLIGDEKLHPDPALVYGPKSPAWAGGDIQSIPEWVKSGGTSPVGRTTFVAFRFYDADSPLLPSGLLGPVMIYSK